MRTRRELNRSYMIGMFVEGFAEVEQMHEHLRAKIDGRASPHEDGLYYRSGFTEFAFEAQLEHAYHHLNWTWGCRHATLERAAKCSQRDFRAWEKFPLAFRELLPAMPRRAVGLHAKTVLHVESIRLGLDEAVCVGNEIYLGLCAHFDAATCPMRWDRRAAEVASLTERARQRRRCYPAEFPAFLTKRHCRQHGL